MSTDSNVIPIRSNSPALKDAERDWVTAPELCTLAGLSFRQADYWTRTGLITPIDEATPGQGNYRRYSAAEVDKAKAVSALLRAGLQLPSIRKHIHEFLSTGQLTTGPVTITYIPENAS